MKGKQISTERSRTFAHDYEDANFNELLILFLKNLDVSKVSRTSYRGCLEQFFKWLERQQISHPKKETIIHYKEYLEEKGLKPTTRANYIMSIRIFFNWTERLGYYANIAWGLKGVKRLDKHHLRDSLSDEDIKQLFHSIDRSTEHGIRDYALINMLARTGLRLIEIVRANYGDLDFSRPEGVLLWIRGKGRAGKDQLSLLTDEVLAPLDAYLKTRKELEPEAPLFCSVSDRSRGKRLNTGSLSRIIAGYLKKCGIKTKRITPHSLRHTFAILCLKSGATLGDTQKALRHSSPQTTEIYLGDLERQLRLKDAPEKKISSIFNKAIEL